MGAKSVIDTDLGVRFILDNRTRYSTRDLARFFARGLHAYGAKGPRHIVVVPSPIRSRGCAEIGESIRKQGEGMVIAIASPSRFDLRRFSRLFEHEVMHTKGQRHEDMTHDVLWSLGPVPKWAKGLKIRWNGR